MPHNGTVHQSKQRHTDVADDCRKGEAEYALMDIFLFHAYYLMVNLSILCSWLSRAEAL